MNTTGNTVLITGGGSGIGRALAEAFHGLGNRVIIAGRGRKMLDETTAANSGMKSLTLDIADAASIKLFAEQVTQEFPGLNVLINNAGIMRPENLLEPQPDLTDAIAMVKTNLLGPMHLTTALLPLLRRQPHAAIVNVSSGLAFVPMARTPTYCATKAAIHSYTQSLRYQLKDSQIQVVELVPPYVATTLMGDAQANDPHAMSLNDFISEIMDIIRAQPDATELCVKRVYPLRFAADGGQEQYRRVFQGLNDAVSTSASSAANSSSSRL